MHALIAHVAAAHPDVAVLVREHPGAPLGADERVTLLAHPGVRLVPGAEWPVADVLHAGGAVVAIYSTSLLEAASVGTVPVVFNPTSMPRLSPDIAGLG